MAIRLINNSRKGFIIIAIFTILLFVMACWYYLTWHQWRQEISTPGFQGKTVVIDPGHGGIDPGASVGKVTEADLNTRIAFALGEQLKLNGIKVAATRQAAGGLVAWKKMSYWDRFQILEQRKLFAIENKAHLLISIHVNSCKDQRASGGIVFYSDPESRGLAECIQTELNYFWGGKRKVEQGNFTIIQDNIMPSVLIETGFISNKGDRNILQNNSNQLARSICQGILNYTNRPALQNFANKGERD